MTEQNSLSQIQHKEKVVPIYCPTCGKEIADEDEHLWWVRNREYCSQRCAQMVKG